MAAEAGEGVISRPLNLQIIGTSKPLRPPTLIEEVVVVPPLIPRLKGHSQFVEQLLLGDLKRKVLFLF